MWERIFSYIKHVSTSKNSSAHNISEHNCTKCGMRFKRKDNFLRHMRRQHPMTHVVSTDTEIINSAKDSENTVENPKDLQETNQSGGGLTTNETSDCITEEEAINENLKVYNLPALDKAKCDPLQFLSSNYDKVKKILRTVL